MAESSPPLIPFPREGFIGIQALIELGEEKIVKLAEIQASQPLDLSFSRICEQLAEQLACDASVLRRAFLQALIPLNGLRRTLEMEPTEFLDSLDYTLSRRAPNEWRDQYLEGLKEIIKRLRPFFEQDNFFSLASKAFDLLSERAAVFREAKILTELRPIFDEAATKTLAVVQTNTLVLSYWDGDSTRSLHITLDGEDMANLQEVLSRAEEKIRISRKEARDRGDIFVTYDGDGA